MLSESVRSAVARQIELHYHDQDLRRKHCGRTGDGGFWSWICNNQCYLYSLALSCRKTARRTGVYADALAGRKDDYYQSDRYRRTTTDTERYSVQTTFSQFVSALHQQQSSSDSSALVQVLNSQTQSSNASGGGGINLGIFSLGGGGGSSSSSSSSSAVDLSTQASASQFSSVAQQASTPTCNDRSRSAATRTLRRSRRRNESW